MQTKSGCKLSGKRSRTKGHNQERHLAELFREAGFPNARRMLEYHSDDAKGVDLQNTGPYLIQSKATKNYVPINTIEEIQLDKFPEDSIPVLVAKADRKKPVAVLYLDDFMDMVKALKEIEQKDFHGRVKETNSYFTDDGNTDNL